MAGVPSGCELKTESLLRRAPAGELHAAAPIWRDGVRVVHCVPSGRALVLGSRQSGEILDQRSVDERGLEVVRRRSGGGAVLVDPEDSLWIDIEVGVEDPRYLADPMAMMAAVGKWWMVALQALECCPSDIWQFEGAMECDAGGDLLCFAGRAHGELLAGHSKLVGLSQRRTRDGARVQGQLHFEDPTDLLLGALAEPPASTVRRPALIESRCRNIVASELHAALVTAVR